MKKFIATTFAVLCVAGANAGIISADFRTVGDLTVCCTSAGPLETETLGATVDANIEHGPLATISNPTNWSGGIVYVDIDPITNVLTLDSQDTLDFESFVLYIENITFSGSEAITGLSLISNALVTPLIEPTFTFTENSIKIGYFIGAGDAPFNFTENNASFQIQVGPVDGRVPAPTGVLLIGLGIVALSRSFKKK
jgi:hypothetical protein